MPKRSETATLLITCRDQKGLVATVAKFVSAHGGNIIHADQHTDPEKGVFFQRVEYELDGFDLDSAGFREAFTPIADGFGMRWAHHVSADIPRMAVFVSKHAHCLYDLLSRWAMGEFRAEIPLVVSNHADLAPVAEKFGVPFHYLPVTEETRSEQEARALELLEDEGIEMVVLARYMQILTSEFVTRFPNRIINIHHSFLPAFVGGNPYRQAHNRGVKVIGATAHFVTDGLDEGPIIEQGVARASHRDSVQDLVHKGKDLERTVLAKAVSLYLERRVLVYDNRTVVFD